MTRIPRLMLAAAIAVVLVAGSASAYVFTDCGGTICRWKTFPVGYLVSESIADLFPGALEIAQKSLTRWNHTQQTFCTIDLKNGGTTPKAVSEADEDNIVFAVKNDWPYTRETLAITQCFYDAQGYLRDCDIMVNAQDWEWDDHFAGDTVLNLQDTLTHEGGHMWGLGHSTVQDATMYAYYSERVIAGDLDEDDIRAGADRYCDGEMPPDDSGEQNDSLYLTHDPFSETAMTGLRLYDNDTYRVQVQEARIPLIEIHDQQPDRHKWVRIYSGVRDLLGEERCDGDCVVAPTLSTPGTPIAYLEIATDFDRSPISAETYSLTVTQVTDVDPAILTDDDVDSSGDDDDDDSGGWCGFVEPTGTAGPGPGTGLPFAAVAALLAGLLALAGRALRPWRSRAR